jgi:hypothetical protein
MLYSKQRTLLLLFRLTKVCQYCQEIAIEITAELIALLFSILETLCCVFGSRTILIQMMWVLIRLRNVTMVG